MQASAVGMLLIGILLLYGGLLFCLGIAYVSFRKKKK